MMDKQERQLRQIPGVDVTRTADNELKVTVRNDVLFDYNSAGLRPASRESLREMANVFEQYPNTTIAVLGFTDSTGSASYNERLSQRRAGSVANYIEDLGVRDSRIDTIGYGESYPRASNDTPHRPPAQPKGGDSDSREPGVEQSHRSNERRPRWAPFFVPVAATWAPWRGSPRTLIFRCRPTLLLTFFRGLDIDRA